MKLGGLWFPLNWNVTGIPVVLKLLPQRSRRHAIFITQVCEGRSNVYSSLNITFALVWISSVCHITLLSLPLSHICTSAATISLSQYINADQLEWWIPRQICTTKTSPPVGLWCGRSPHDVTSCVIVNYSAVLLHFANTLISNRDEMLINFVGFKTVTAVTMRSTTFWLLAYILKFILILPYFLTPGTSVGRINCCWPSPVQSFLVPSPADTSTCTASLYIPYLTKSRYSNLRCFFMYTLSDTRYMNLHCFSTYASLDKHPLHQHALLLHM
jgi:hypothetical protein